MKPVAVIIIEEESVRVEPVEKRPGSLIEQLAVKIPSLIKKEIDEREERKGKEKEAEEKSGGEKGKGKEIKVE